MKINGTGRPTQHLHPVYAVAKRRTSFLFTIARQNSQTRLRAAQP